MRSRSTIRTTSLNLHSLSTLSGHPVLKFLVNAVFTLLTLPLVAVYRVESVLFGVDRIFPGWSQFVSLIPGLYGVYIRRAFYRFTLDACGANATIGFGSLFSHPTARLGANVYVGNYCMLGGVTIEDDCLIASHVSILNGLAQHRFDRLDIPIREQPGEFAPITIGRDSWIGERAVIAANVGPQCVVGAGSVVTKDLPPRAIAVGTPARVVKRRGEPAIDDAPPSAALE
ncbi:MAG: acyltransferase [Planctomycetaceae bacterium]|nr:acyltransferase [Planctomycetaceae bacterium]